MDIVAVEGRLRKSYVTHTITSDLKDLDHLSSL